MVDYLGEDGQTIELGKGWYYRIDSQETSTQTQRHIHIWNEKKVEYIQNEDGSPHDKHKGQKGKIPNWLNKKIKQKAGWDYNKNRKSFFEKTSIAYTDSYIIATRPYSMNYTYSSNTINSYEGIYFSTSSLTAPKSVNNKILFIPTPSSPTLPLPAFGFYNGLIPIPIP